MHIICGLYLLFSSVINTILKIPHIISDYISPNMSLLILEKMLDHNSFLFFNSLKSTLSITKQGLGDCCHQRHFLAIITFCVSLYLYSYIGNRRLKLSFICWLFVIKFLLKLRILIVSVIVQIMGYPKTLL